MVGVRKTLCSAHRIGILQTSFIQSYQCAASKTWKFALKEIRLS